MSTRGLVAPWPRGAAARPAGTAKGPAQVLAQSRQQLAQAREQGHSEECICVLEWKVLKEEAETKQAQPMGQRMDQARARFLRAVEAGEKAQEAMLEAQASFEQAQQEVVQAQLDLHRLMQEAPLPAMPAPQVNVSLVKSLEALTEAGPPPVQLIHAIQESRAILETSLAILSQEGRAAMEAETSAEQDPELWDQDEDEAEEMEGFEEAHAPGGMTVEVRQARKAAAERTPMTPPQQKKTRTTEPEALAKGSARLSQVQLLSTRAMQNRKEHGTGDAFATSMRADPSFGKFLKFCFLSICTVACSHARPGRRWPTCFDQTCGYRGEGPLTTLDASEGPEPSLTPTQELRTCVTVRRKTKGDKWRNQVCRPCKSSLTPTCEFFLRVRTSCG